MYSPLHTAPAGLPQDFTITPEDATTLIFTWEPPVPTGHNESITGYTLSCDPTVDGLPNTYNYTTLNITIGGFRPFTDYNCSVSASTSEGDGPPASELVTTPEDSEYIVFAFFVDYGLEPFRHDVQP